MIDIGLGTKIPLVMIYQLYDSHRFVQVAQLIFFLRIFLCSIYLKNIALCDVCRIHVNDCLDELLDLH